MAESIKATLTRREFYRNKASESASVTSIEGQEIPQQVDDLIDNKMYRNKFKSLIRKGHLQDLLDLAEVAKDKDTPSRWFAKSTRTTPVPGNEGKPTHWERSLKFLAKLRKVRRVVQQVSSRLKVPANSVNAVFKAAWKHQEAAVRLAVTAAETGKSHPFGLFCALALREPTNTPTA
ncbi:hypothetical protein ACFUN8_03840 [Streptomyces sp. NPDC057307]|uniref:hypothetical protein n=1 Tax=Streptomyces sp. NPDC057307 TaxID=3346096 RepID=UPI00362E9153